VHVLRYVMYANVRIREYSTSTFSESHRLEALANESGPRDARAITRQLARLFYFSPQQHSSGHLDSLCTMAPDKSPKPSEGGLSAVDTLVARYNRAIFRTLKKELAKNPEMDIGAALPKYYSDKLKSLQESGMSFFSPSSADDFD
jgi:hypothetical protein